MPLYDALQETLEQLAILCANQPESWRFTPEGRRTQGALIHGIRVMAQAAGVPPDFIQEGIPSMN